MDQQKYIKMWINGLKQGLSEINKKIEKMEIEKDDNDNLSIVQKPILEEWIADDNTPDDMKEELKGTLDYVSRVPQENNKKLESLKKEREIYNLMISRLESKLS